MTFERTVEASWYRLSADFQIMNATGLNDTLDMIRVESFAETQPLVIFANVVMGLNIVLNAVLNPLCLVALRRAKNIQGTTKMFMASLTVSDLCIGLFCGVPLWTINITGKFLFGSFLCTLTGVLYPTFNTLNTLSLLLLTIDRFIAIVHSLRYPMLVTTFRSKIIIASLWVFTLLVYSITLGIFKQAYLIGDQCVPTCELCNYVYIGLLVIPLGVILIIYVWVLKVARRQARRIAAQFNIGNSQLRPNAPQRPSTKSASTVFIIAGVLFVCWMPHTILLVLLSQGIALPNTTLYIITQSFVYTIYWLNTVIYYWRNRELRQALNTFISAKCCC